MSVIGIDAAGTYLAVAPDVYLGGKFIALDAVAPVAASPDLLIGLAVLAVFALLFGASDGGGASRPVLGFGPVPAPPLAVVPVPAPLLLLAGGLLILRAVVR